MGKTGSKHMNNKDFGLIKTLHEAGVKSTKIKEITDRSLGTIARVNQASTYADYKRVVHKANKDYREKAKALAMVETPAPIPTEIKHGIDRPALPASDSITISREGVDEIMQKLNFIITHMVVDPNRQAPEDKHASKVHGRRLSIFS